MKDKIKVLVFCFLCAGVGTPVLADNVFREDLELSLVLDSASVDSEGDELEDLDDVEVNGSEIPEWYTSRFVNDTFFINCNVEELPYKFVLQGKNGTMVYKLLPQFMVGDTTLLTHHPADSVYHFMWTTTNVNPYGRLFDSLQNDVHIPMKGFRLPAPGYVTSPYGMRKYRMHKGTDIKVQIGDSIHAAWDGQVRIASYDPKGYGYYVVIRHDNGLETIYGHLSALLVEEFDRISAGDVLGLGGNTGRSTGSHLHFEIRYLGEAMNPANFIDFSTGKLKDETEYVIGIKAMKQAKAEQAAMKYHKIKSGDTLSSIAKKYGTTVKRLCQLNGINANKVLKIGTSLRVR